MLRRNFFKSLLGPLVTIYTPNPADVLLGKVTFLAQSLIGLGRLGLPYETYIMVRMMDKDKFIYIVFCFLDANSVRCEFPYEVETIAMARKYTKYYATKRFLPCRPDVIVANGTTWA